MESGRHPKAIVHPNAIVHETVYIGPYAVIGDQVEIGAHCRVGAHCVISGPTILGESNNLRPHAVLGGDPQDKKYAQENTQLIIGNNNTFHEFVTVNRGTAQGGGITRIADNNWFMAYVHIAHDCQIGSNTVLSNSVALAGHVDVGDWSVIGGLTGVHQFTRIGQHAMVGFCSHISQDVAPYIKVAGNPSQVHGLNSVGLRRRGFAACQISVLKNAYRSVFRLGNSLAEACLELQRQVDGLDVQNGREEVLAMLHFLQHSQRGIVR